MTLQDKITQMIFDRFGKTDRDLAHQIEKEARADERGSMKSRLKPCPFCGSKANGPHEINMYPFGFPPRTHWEIICQSFCTKKKAESSELVIKKWNTRVSADEIEKPHPKTGL